MTDEPNQPPEKTLRADLLLVETGVVDEWAKRSPQDVQAPDPKLAAEVADNSCGVAPFETGPWDPYTNIVCHPHDAIFDELVEGHKTDLTNFQTIMQLFRNCLYVLIQSIYAIVTFPLYVVIGGVGGYLRWKYLEWKLKRSSNGGK